MNIEKLIAAAKEIDRLAEKQSAKTQQLIDLAAAARAAENDEHLRHIQRQQREISSTVVDYGNAINALRKALKARPSNAAKPQEIE